MEFNNELEDAITPYCPYCGNNTQACEHVLLNYDASFTERLSGYLFDDDHQIEYLKEQILRLLTIHKRLKLKSGLVKDIWEYAATSFEQDDEEIDFDETSYFNLLDNLIDDFDGESMHYSDDDNAAPGFCSAYIIFFAKNPMVTTQRINNHILRELKQAAQKKQDSKKLKKRIKSTVF